MSETTSQKAIAALNAMAQESPEFAEALYTNGSHIMLSKSEVEEAYGDSEPKDSTLTKLVEWSRLARRHGFSTGKDFYGSYADIDFKMDGAYPHFGLTVHRETVCTPRVVGTRETTKPDPNAPRITVTENVIEWDCHPLLAAEDGK